MIIIQAVLQENLLYAYAKNKNAAHLQYGAC